MSIVDRLYDGKHDAMCEAAIYAEGSKTCNCFLRKLLPLARQLEAHAEAMSSALRWFHETYDIADEAGELGFWPGGDNEVSMFLMAAKARENWSKFREGKE